MVYILSKYLILTRDPCILVAILGNIALSGGICHVQILDITGHPLQSLQEIELTKIWKYGSDRVGARLGFVPHIELDSQ